jgi:hypothetical protein
MKLIKRVTIEEQYLAEDNEEAVQRARALLRGSAGIGKDEEGDAVEPPRGAARTGRAKLVLPPISRTRARTGRVPETEDEGETAQANLEDEGGQGDDDGNVVEVARGGARAGRTKPAQPSIARARTRNDR